MQKRNLTFWQLWNLSFGFFGVQIAYSLQSANISRIFTTLGADPHSLSFFWILPPLMGMIVQPLVGKYSDRTWTRFGRRIPYLFLGSLIAIAVMCLLPNAGSFGFAVGGAMIFGLIMLMLLDTSINMAMQPFKMLVGDMVSEEQKAKAYSIQSFLCNAGSIVGFVLPFVLAQFMSNEGEGVSPVVKMSFYIGAAVLILCVIYTTLKVKEMPPKEYAEFHGIDLAKKETGPKPGMLALLKDAPSTFWTVGLVQFFCWAAFLYMWTYTTGALTETIWVVPDYLQNIPAALESVDKDLFVKFSTEKKLFLDQAGDWTGILFAVQAIGSVLWALVIPKFKSIKKAYSVSLLIGAVGFASVFFIHNQYALFASFLAIGVAWAAMLAVPFTLLTNSLKGDNIGTYLGLFNGTICLPQIVAAALGGVILGLVGGGQLTMFLVAAGCLVAGALSIKFIKTR
jgi:maltose/moltooligosaccharide transporter